MANAMPARTPRESPCEHRSDLEVLGEALIAIVAGLMTILLIFLRHPFRILLALVIIGIFTGWWVA